MNGQMVFEHKIITTQVIRHSETGLFVALSDEMKGLYVHARSEEELLERIPVAIRDLLEADGFAVAEIAEVDIPPEAEAGFLPALRRFEASVTASKAA